MEGTGTERPGQTRVAVMDGATVPAGWCRREEPKIRQCPQLLGWTATENGGGSAGASHGELRRERREKREKNSTIPVVTGSSSASQQQCLAARALDADARAQ